MKLNKFFTLIFTLLFTLQFVACGTLLYPERRGQTSGQIDPAVALMNGVGILFFVIPGVIAFAVDFVTGSIYLPGGKRASLDEQTTSDVVSVPIGNAGMTIFQLQDIIKGYNSLDVDLFDRNMSVVSVLDSKTAKDMLLVFDNVGLRRTSSNIALR